jgi:hypothetical protein
LSFEAQLPAEDDQQQQHEEEAVEDGVGGGEEDQNGGGELVYGIGLFCFYFHIYFFLWFI